MTGGLIVGIAVFVYLVDVPEIFAVCAVAITVESLR